MYAPFPFQEGDEFKERPTLVLVTELPADTAIVCMVTSKAHRFDTCIELHPDDFIGGGMDAWPSYIRPYRIATIRTDAIRKRLGQVKQECVEKIRSGLVKCLTT